jgi:glycosyltransferase involved in cell wall biosynthesis
VIYLNAYYRFYCRDGFGLPNQCDACERKGWRFWPEIRKAFPGSLGLVSNCEVVDGTVGFKAKDIVDVYRLLALGRVYAHLSTHEGFGLNPLMAAAMGAAVVSWDIVPVREVLPEAVLVPAQSCTACHLYPYDIMARGTFTACWGSVGEFIEAVKKVLGSPPAVDWQAVRQKFSAQKLYARLA